MAAAGEFGPGEYRVIDVDDLAIAVFNLDCEYFAIEDVCTPRLRQPHRRVRGRRPGHVPAARRMVRHPYRKRAHPAGLRAGRHVPGEGRDGIVQVLVE